jgi:hypothetical protein
MAGRERVARLAAAGALVGVPGIPLLLLVALALFLVAFMNSVVAGPLPDYWSYVATGWLSAFFSFATVGVLAGYWLPRAELLGRGRGSYVPAPDDRLLSYVGVLPLVAYIVLILEWGGDPGWLYGLGMLSLLFGMGAMLDSYLVLRRSPSGKKRRGRGGDESGTLR